MTKYQRPESLKFPTIYREFKAKRDDIKFRIQDLTEESFGEAVDMIHKYFMTEETVAVGRKVLESPEATNFTLSMYSELLKEKLSIGCFEERSGKLVGVNFMAVHSKDNKMSEVKLISVIFFLVNNFACFAYLPSNLKSVL